MKYAIVKFEKTPVKNENGEVIRHDYKYPPSYWQAEKDGKIVKGPFLYEHSGDITGRCIIGVSEEFSKSKRYTFLTKQEAMRAIEEMVRNTPAVVAKGETVIKERIRRAQAKVE